MSQDKVDSAKASVKVTIIGSGLVGKSWALIFARAGHSVVLYDSDEKQTQTALPSILKDAQMLQDAGLLQANQTPQSVVAHVSLAHKLEDAIQGATYIQECVPEALTIKTKVYEDLDRILSSSVSDSSATASTSASAAGAVAASPSPAFPSTLLLPVLASSTSNIASSQFTHKLKVRAQCLVAHPVNPPFAIPLVEIVPSPWTDPGVVAFTRRLLTEAGQSPIVLKKEVDGFILNRLQYALLQEAYRLVEDGVASPEDIDTAVSSGLGLRWSFMGPFETIDLNAPKGVGDYCTRYCDSIHRVVQTQDNTREWKRDVVEAIEKSMRTSVPVDKLGDRVAWRNNRLLQLAAHKQQQKRLDQHVSGTDVNQRTSDDLVVSVPGQSKKRKKD